MLGCARIGAVHSVVFGGFSAESLRDRINDQQARLLVTADGGYRRGQVVPLKQVADEAVAGAPSIEHVIVVQRGGCGTPGQGTKAAGAIPVPMTDGRDHWYHALMAAAALRCDPEPMDAEDLLWILYTSGTTGKPKGIVDITVADLIGPLRDDELVHRGRRRVLVYGRYRLGDGRQLRRRRSARRRRDRGAVRGAPDRPRRIGTGRWWTYGVDGRLPRRIGVRYVHRRRVGLAAEARHDLLRASVGRRADRSARRGVVRTSSSAARAVSGVDTCGRPKPARP